MDIPFSDLTYSYDEDNISQSYFASKYELSSLQESKKYGPLYKHQEIIKRVILFKDKVFLFHKVGTGKSAASFGASEQFTNYFLNVVDDFVHNYISTNRTTIKRIYYLTKGPTLVNNARRELVCTVADRSKYITEEVLEAPSNKIFRSRLRKEVGKYYSIETYYSFVSSIDENISDNELIEQFSNCMFIGDEIQELSTETITDEEDEGDETEQDNKKIYSMLHRIFHLVKNSKIILMSATPMIDKPKEIEDTMNLLLPLDNQMNIKDYSKVTINDLKRYFRGYISYVGDLYEENTQTTPQFVGSTLSGKEIRKVNDITLLSESYLSRGESKVILKKNTLSKFQLEKYLDVVNANEGKFYSRERQILNFAYLNSSKYIKRLGPDRYIFDDPDITTQSLSKYSTKISDVVDECINGDGNRFVFSNFVGMGVRLLTCAFRLFGIEQYIGSNTAFSGQASAGYCPTDRSNQGNILIRKGLRFAVITTETNVTHADRIIELFNSYENRHGEYIKIIIGSPKTQIGISLLNVLGIHILDPYWNFSTNYQAFSRGLRKNSFVDILGYMIENNLRPKIFLHCAVTDKIATIDEMLYITGEEKDIDIKRIERMMKILSFDCMINRRVLTTLNDYSPICDYQKCNYECYDESKEEIEYDSYNVLYSQELIDNIIKEIKLLFKEKYMVSINYLFHNLKQKFTRTQLLLALEKLYDEKNPVTNRFGYQEYFQIIGDYLVIRDEYPELNDVNLINNFYGDNVFINHRRKMDDFIEDELYDELMKEIKDINEKSKKEVINLVSNMIIEKQSLLLERAIIHQLLDKMETYEKYVIDHFKAYIIHTTYPEIAVNQLEDYIRQRGRKKINVHIKVLNTLDYSGNKKVILNTLLVNSVDKTGYRVTVNTITRDLRILDVEEAKQGYTDRFREATTNEIVVIDHRLNSKKDEEEEEEDTSLISGSISHVDNNFRIAYKKDVEIGNKDHRKQIRGRKCMTYDTSKLIEILMELGVEDKNVTKYPVNMNKQQLVEFLLGINADAKDKSVEYMKAYYNWYTRVSKDELCEIIRKSLEEKGLLRYI